MEFMKNVACVLVGMAPVFPSAYAQNAPYDALVHYSFNDAGNLGADDSGKGNNAAVHGSPTWVAAGRMGGGVSLDGVDDWLVANTLSQVVTGDATVSCWLKALPSMSKSGRLLDLATSGGVGLQIVIDSSGRTGFDNSGGPSTELKGPAPVNDGNWHHVAVVRTGSTYTLYVDGQGVGSQTGTAPSYSRLFVGVRADQTSYSAFEGSLDEVRVYARALSDAEIVNLYASSPPAPPAPPPPPGGSSDGREGANGDDSLNDTLCGGSVGAGSGRLPAGAPAVAALALLGLFIRRRRPGHPAGGAERNRS